MSEKYVQLYVIKELRYYTISYDVSVSINFRKTQ